jgi:hypothetical protein
MTRIATTYYGADPTTQFQWATAGSDQFSRIYDLYYLAQAVEYHDHSNTRGLAVARVADGSLTAASYGALSVGTAALANLGVTNAKLGDLSVSTGKLQDGSVTAVKIAAGAVGITQLADASVTIAKLFDRSVTTTKIGLLAVTSAELADTSVGTAKIVDGAINRAKIANLAIGVNQLDTNAVGAGHIIDGSVGTAEITDGAVTTNKIGDGQVTAAKLASGVGTVPSGLIAAVPTAAQIPSGWTRYTNGDGRFLIGAGTTFSQTFNENNNWGASNWTPVTGLTTDVPTSNFLAAAASSNNATNATNVGTSTHLHTINGQSAVWIPPSRVVVWCQKS